MGMNRLVLTGCALACLILYAAQAQGEAERRVHAPSEAASALHPLEWAGWTEPLARQSTSARAAHSINQAPEAPEVVDVVDAHWMALTMWGEARNGGEEGMRAVGHVIDNRRRSAGRSGFATDTVSEAWQFSCWNRGDPNREAMLNIHRLSKDSRDYEAWQLAKVLAADILSGRSRDPTDGSLFYHADSVSPRWSRGLVPARRIGSHLFFRTAV